MALPPMGVTIYGRPQGAGTAGATSSLELTVHHPGGGRVVHRVGLWDHGDILAHQYVTGPRDKNIQGVLADWVDENADQFQSVPREYRPYLGQLIRRGHRWPPEPPESLPGTPPELGDVSENPDHAPDLMSRLPRGAVRRYAMNEEAGFHQAMKADPYDNTSRLVYADWLDEHGKPEAAARLRWWTGAHEYIRSKRGRTHSQWEGGRKFMEGQPTWIKRLATLADFHRHHDQGADNSYGEIENVADPVVGDAAHQAETVGYGLAPESSLPAHSDALLNRADQVDDGGEGWESETPGGRQARTMRNLAHLLTTGTSNTAPGFGHGVSVHMLGHLMDYIGKNPPPTPPPEPPPTEQGAPDPDHTDMHGNPAGHMPSHRITGPHQMTRFLSKVEVKRYVRPVRYSLASHEDFHRAIHANPEEDINHLAYADWLQEQGHGTVAKLIREAVRSGRRWLDSGEAIERPISNDQPWPVPPLSGHQLYVWSKTPTDRHRVIAYSPKPTPLALGTVSEGTNTGVQQMSRRVKVRRYASGKARETGDALREVAFALNDELELGPDYNRLFWNPDTKAVWYTTADSDDSETVKKVHDALKKVPGVDNVRLEAECNPPKDSTGWFQMYDRNDQDEGWKPWPPKEKKSHRTGVKRYAGETTEDQFQQMLDANPDDHQTRGVLADFLEERGDPRAAGYRALGKLGKRPLSGRRHIWLLQTDQGDGKYGSTHPHTLPKDWFNNTGGYVGGTTRRDAEDYAAIAFSKLPPERQHEIMNPPADTTGHMTGEPLSGPQQMSRVGARRYVKENTDRWAESYSEEPGTDLKILLEQHKKNLDDVTLQGATLDKIMDDHGVTRTKARALRRKWLKRYAAYRKPPPPPVPEGWGNAPGEWHHPDGTPMAPGEAFTTSGAESSQDECPNCQHQGTPVLGEPESDGTVMAECPQCGHFDEYPYWNDDTHGPEPMDDSVPHLDDEPEQYDAYRSPKGGMVVRGTHYPGGEMVPDMQGAFANPPVPGAKLSRALVRRYTEQVPPEPPMPPADVPAGDEPEEEGRDCPTCGTHQDDETDIVPLGSRSGRGRTRGQYGDMGCVSCASRCDNCEDWTPDDDLTRAYSGRRSRTGNLQNVCPTCLGNDYFECADCSDHFHTDYPGGNNSSGDPVCEGCGENYFTCDNCNDVFHTDEYGEDGNCEDCSRSASGLIHDHNYTPDDLTFHGDKGQRHYGVELESVLDRGDLHRAAEEVIDKLGDDFVYLKNDSSLHGGVGSFEIVTHPATLEVHKEKWPKLLMPNTPAGLVSHDNPSCGLHVHVEREGLSDLTVGKVLSFTNALANRPFVEALARRSSNRFAKLDETKKPQDATKGGRSRYEAVNLQNDDTIEFRIFKGTFKPETFFRSLEFADAAVEFARTANYSLRDMIGTDRFFEFVGLNRKRYPHLHDFVLKFQGIEPPVKREPPKKMWRATSLPPLAPETPAKIVVKFSFPYKEDQTYKQSRPRPRGTRSVKMEQGDGGISSTLPGGTVSEPQHLSRRLLRPPTKLTVANGASAEYTTSRRPLLRGRGMRTTAPVVRYSATGNDVNNLMTQLQAPEQNNHRWGLDGSQHGLRHVLADALDENGRSDEAGVLREPNRHVMIRDGKVLPAVFTTEHVDTAHNALWNHAADINYDTPPPEPTYNVEDFRPEDMHDRGGFQTPTPPGHVRVIWPDQGGSDYHSWADVPYAHLGTHFADSIENHLSDIGHEDEDPEYDQRRQDLENAPYEDMDTSHPLGQKWLAGDTTG